MLESCLSLGMSVTANSGNDSETVHAGFLRNILDHFNLMQIEQGRVKFPTRYHNCVEGLTSLCWEAT